MKKLVSAMMALILLLGLFSLTGAAADEQITLNLWHKDTGVKGDLYQKYVDEFMAEHPNIKVEITVNRSDAYKEKLPISFSGNQQPDVFFTWGGSWLKNFVDAGHVMDLTGKVDTSSFYPTAVANAEFDGKLYGLPLGIDIGVLFYNKEIFAQYGLEAPSTFEDLIHVCEVLKENNIIPFVLANQPKWPGSFYFMYLVDRIGGPEAYAKALSREGAFNDEAFVKAGEAIERLVSLNVFNPGYNGLTYDAGPGRQLLYTGQTAMMLLSNTFVNLMRAEAPEFEEKMGICAFPAVEGGLGDPSDLVGIAAPEWSISANTKYPEESLMLLQYLTCKEIAQEYADTTGAQSARNDVHSADPFVQKLEEMTANAANIQMVYDQNLPAELVDVHLSTTQEIFGQTMTAQEAADAVEAKAQEVLK